MKKFIYAISAIVISAAALFSCGNDEGVLLEHTEDAYHIVETEPVSTLPKVRPAADETSAVEDKSEENTETTAKADDKSDEKNESSQTVTKAPDEAVEATEAPENNEPPADNSGENTAVEETTTAAEREEYYLEGVVYRKSIGGILIKEKDMSLISIGFEDTSLLDGLSLGDEVRVAYDGYIMESYPAQAAHVYDVEIMKKAVYEGEIKHFVCDNPAVSESFTVLLPEDWTVSEIEYPTEGDFTDWGFRIIPKGETTGLDITWHSSFSIREPYDVFPVTVNGYDAKKYGANGKWRFYGYENGYVASNNFYNTGKYDEYADDFEFILNTLVFGQHDFIGE